MRAPQTVLVAYRSPLWVKVAVGSFLAHFPDQHLLVVDNNPRHGERGWRPECEEDRAWLSAHPRIRLLSNDGPVRSHGRGMDLALAWCRDHGVETMLHIESDCHVRGVQWYRNLVAAVDGGAAMAACHRKSWGPLHPCPSLWRVGEVRSSFDVDNHADMAHPRFAELIDLEAFRRNSAALGVSQTFFWDTGLRAWFDAAVEDRAVQVPGPDFAHYWKGSIDRQQHLHLFLDPRLLRYARPPLRLWAQVVGGRVAAEARRLAGRPRAG